MEGVGFRVENHPHARGRDAFALPSISRTDPDQDGDGTGRLTQRFVRFARACEAVPPRRLLGICNTVVPRLLGKMTSCLEIQPSRTVPGTRPSHAQAFFSCAGLCCPKRLQVKCGCCERDTPTSAAFCPGRRWRPPGTLDPCRSLAAEFHARAIVGPSYLAAIVAAGFLRCTEQL